VKPKELEDLVSRSVWSLYTTETLVIKA